MCNLTKHNPHAHEHVGECPTYVLHSLSLTLYSQTFTLTPVSHSLVKHVVGRKGPDNQIWSIHRNLEWSVVLVTKQQIGSSTDYVFPIK